MNNSKIPKKISFEVLLETCRIFYCDTGIEDQFAKLIEEYASRIRNSKIISGQPSKQNVMDFLRNEPDSVIRIISILGISKEKFKRIISVVRQLNGIYDGKEWTMIRIEKEIKFNGLNNPFSTRLIDLFLSGYKDIELQDHIPKIYLERFKLQTLNNYQTEEQLIFNLKDRYYANYNNMKGDNIENIIKAIVTSSGQTFASGSTKLVNTTVDVLVPNKEDPRILIMSSYQETTASAQSNKARDMQACYQEICRRNRERNELRYFINFVDGGGWIARRNDLRKIYDACHFCLNLTHIDQLRQIISYVFNPSKTNHYKKS
jgi:hypothetical protein